MAHHNVDSVLPSTSAISLSVAALFLDLEKAFDRAVREAVMGYPSHVGSCPISRRISKISVFPWFFAKSCA